MTMTNLGVTKEEMIYQFVISLNKGGYASGVYAGEVVAKAIGEYDALVNKGIIKEEDPTEELRKGLNRVRNQMIMDKAYDMSVDGFNELMAYLEPIPTGEKVEMYNMAGDVINTINMRKSNTFPTEGVNM